MRRFRGSQLLGPLQERAFFLLFTGRTISLLGSTVAPDRDRVLRGGLRVYTTIDPQMQTAAWDSIFNPASTDTPLSRTGSAGGGGADSLTGGAIPRRAG